MQLTIFEWYLVIINVLAVILYTVDRQYGRRGGKRLVPLALLRMTTIFGGAPGTILAGLLPGKKRKSTNPLSAVFTGSWLVLQIVILLGFYGPFKAQISGGFTSFFMQHMLLCAYLILINTVTFFSFIVDKVRAMSHQWRIRESALLGMSLIGGALGGWMAMDLSHHKVKKSYFAIGVPAMLLGHLILLIVLITGIL